MPRTTKQTTATTGRTRAPAGKRTEEEYRAKRAVKGELPREVWSGVMGVKVLGPYSRPKLDEHGYVRSVRRYYRLTFPDPLKSGGRGHKEAKTKELAVKEARRIDGNLAAGLPPQGAPNDDKTVHLCNHIPPTSEPFRAAWKLPWWTGSTMKASGALD